MTEQPIKLCKDCKHFWPNAAYPEQSCDWGYVDYVNGGRLKQNAQAARHNWASCSPEAYNFQPKDDE